MILESTRGKIRGVSEAFSKAYPESRYPDAQDSDKASIRRNLAALDGETASKEQVDAIIGNGSWTAIKCDECEKQVEAVVRLGDEPDDECSTVYVCKDCLASALDLISAQ